MTAGYNADLAENVDVYLEAIFKKTRDAILLTDDSGRYIQVNPAAVEILGYSEKELLSMSVADLIDGSQGINLQQLWKAFVDEGAQTVVIDLVKHDGSRLSCLYNATANILPGIHLFILTDVTERRQLESQLERSEEVFRSIFDKSGIGMALLDQSGKFIEVNLSLCSMLGYSKAELASKRIKEISHEDDFADDLYTMNSLFSGRITSSKRTSRYLHKGGYVVWVSVTMTAIQNKQGALTNYIIQVEDITDRRHVEVALQQREQEYKSLFDQNPLAVFSLNTNGLFKSANLAATKLTGRRIQDLKGRSFVSLCVSRDRKRISNLLVEAAKGFSFNFETSLAQPNESIVELNITTMPVMIAGEIEGVHCIATDVTESRRRSRDRALISKIHEIFRMERNIAECLRLVLYGLCEGNKNVSIAEAWATNYSDDCMWLSAEYFNSSRVHDSQVRMARRGEGLVGTTYSRRKPLLFVDLENNVKYERRKFAAENRIKTALSVPILSYGRVVAVFVFYSNEHKPVADELIEISDELASHIANEIQRKKSELELKSFFNISPDLMCVAGTNGYFRKVNQSFINILGYGHEEFISKPILEFVHPDDRELSAEQLEKLSNGVPVNTFANRLLTKAGESRWFEWSAVPQAEKGLIFGAGRDITEKYRLERVVQNEQQRFSHLFNAAPVAMCIVLTRDHVFAHVNEVYKQLVDQPFDIVGQKIRDVFPEFERQGFTKMLDHVFDSGETVFAREAKFEIKTTASGKGRSGYIDFMYQPYRDDEGFVQGVFFFGIDVTERKMAFEELKQKESAIRNFARHLNKVLEDERARIAREIHDEFGQQLTGIKLSLSALKKLRSDYQLERGIEEISNAIDSTSRSLRTFANELRPMILDTLGLVPSIEWLATEFKSKSSIDIKVNIKTRRRNFNKAVSTACFRVCQEALTNISKHSQATKVTVSLTARKKHLLLEVIDNGVGLNSEDVKSPLAMGIANMYDRAQLVNGKLKISEADKGGTRIVLQCPDLIDDESTDS